jgi:hypothetical protein
VRKITTRDEGAREAARDSLRGFIQAIIIPPAEALLEVRGDLGEDANGRRRGLTGDQQSDSDATGKRRRQSLAPREWLLKLDGC